MASIGGLDARIEGLRARARARARRLTVSALRETLEKTERVSSYVRSTDARATFGVLAEVYRSEIEKRQALATTANS